MLAAWGVFDLSGGLYTIKGSQLENISEQYGIDSRNLLNVVYNNKKIFFTLVQKTKVFMKFYLTTQ
ncbi:hypothetical protein ACQ9BO_07745 [Flavobacterium sp. P21]|uniref:hypothetical protein n=1 Tax=Flavobacterium sp. P21 TaxID=3423948 RepID=UPI003D67E045